MQNSLMKCTFLQHNPLKNYITAVRTATQILIEKGGQVLGLSTVQEARRYI